jgi:hypothetical protein
VNLAPAQLTRMSQLSDQWSFLWDKRRSLWIAAEDCPDGEQIEEADLDMLLAQLPLKLWVGDQRNRVATVGGNRAGNSGRVCVSVEYVPGRNFLTFLAPHTYPRHTPTAH